MIPCFSERERHAADLQRLARRADATLGPSRFPSTTRIDGHGEKYLSRGVSFRCRGFSLTPWFGQRVCLKFVRCDQASDGLTIQAYDVHVAPFPSQGGRYGRSFL